MRPDSSLAVRITEREEYYTALACAMHPRLGAESPMAALSTELLRLAIPPWTYPEVPTQVVRETVDRNIPPAEHIYRSPGDSGASSFNIRLLFDGEHVLCEGTVPQRGFIQYVSPASPAGRLVICCSHYERDESRKHSHEHVVAEAFAWSMRKPRLFTAYVFDRVEITRPEDALTLTVIKS